MLNFDETPAVTGEATDVEVVAEEKPKAKKAKKAEATESADSNEEAKPKVKKAAKKTEK